MLATVYPIAIPRRIGVSVTDASTGAGKSYNELGQLPGASARRERASIISGTHFKLRVGSCKISSCSLSQMIVV